MINLDITTMPLVFIDVETTGLSPTKCRITELAAIRVENGEVVDRLVSLFSIGEPLPEFITKLTGITDDMLKDQPTFDTIVEPLNKLLEGAIMVAHNARFDYGFIKEEYRRLGKPFTAITLCTKELACIFCVGVLNHKLETLIKHYKFEVEERHRAEEDASVLIQLMKQFEATAGKDKLMRTAQRVMA